jgi:uncharacterized protein
MANKFAVVTGASSGIGFEVAKVLAQNQFDLAIVADGTDVHQRANELEGFGVDVHSYYADLTKKAAVKRFYEFIEAMDRPIDVLVLNAGVGASGKFTEISLEDDLRLLSLNIFSVVHLAKLVLPKMVERKKGRVMITSSIAALMPGPFFATYAASKSFLLSFSEALFNELKDTGVTVTALMPGATDTEFFKRADMEDTKVGQEEKDDPAMVAKQAYMAMMNGDDHIIAGSLKNKIQGFITHFLSEKMKASFQRTDTEKKSA